MVTTNNKEAILVSTKDLKQVICIQYFIAFQNDSIQVS